MCKCSTNLSEDCAAQTALPAKGHTRPPLAASQLQQLAANCCISDDHHLITWPARQPTVANDNATIPHKGTAFFPEYFVRRRIQQKGGTRPAQASVSQRRLLPRPACWLQDLRTRNSFQGSSVVVVTRPKSQTGMAADAGAARTGDACRIVAPMPCSAGCAC